HGGPERNRRTASGAGPTLAHARGRVAGHGAVGGRDHDSRLTPRHRGVSPQAPTGVCGPESRRRLALAAGGRTVAAALGTEEPPGSVSGVPAQARRMCWRLVVGHRWHGRERYSGEVLRGLNGKGT